jgi:uroporphyrinogen-III synthase
MERGAIPVELPTLRFVDPPSWDAADAAFRALPGEYQGIFFTSTNGVDRTFERWAALGIEAATALRGLRVGVAGAATAEALQTRGVEPHLVPERFLSEGLLELVGARVGPEALRGSRWLLPRALRGRDVLVDGLAAQGALVDVVAVYETLPPEDPGELRRALDGGLDVVTFCSGSSVDSLAGATERPLAEALAGVAVASIGPVTSAACARHGLRVAVQPASSTIPELVDAVDAWASARKW